MSLASTCYWLHTVLNICNLNMALQLKLNGNDFLSLSTRQSSNNVSINNKNE